MSQNDDEDDLFAQIERLFRTVDDKLSRLRQNQQRQFTNDDLVVCRVEKSTECVERRILESLQRQRSELLERLQVEFTASMNSPGQYLVRFRPEIDCQFILNDMSHFIGSISYANQFTLLKKLTYFPLLNQFNGEIKLAKQAQQTQPQIQSRQQHSIRIIVLVSVKRLFVYLNQMEGGNDGGEGGKMCGYFKMFNYKWDELASIRCANSWGHYKNLLAYEDRFDSKRRQQRRIRIVALFAESENGRHSLMVYDHHLTLLASCELDFNLRLISIIGDNNLEEIVCWRSDTNRMLVFNFSLKLVDEVGQERDPSGIFYFGGQCKESLESLESLENVDDSSSSCSSVNLIDVSSRILLIYTSDDVKRMQRVSIVSRINGLVQGCIEFGYNSFPSMIKIDSCSNILVRTCDSGDQAMPIFPAPRNSLIKYFDFRGNLLVQLGADLNNNNNLANPFDSFNRIDLNRERDDELVCFCRQHGIILFF